MRRPSGLKVAGACLLLTLCAGNPYFSPREPSALHRHVGSLRLLQVSEAAETEVTWSQLYSLAMQRGVIKHLPRHGAHEFGFQVDDIPYHCFQVQTADGTIHDLEGFAISENEYEILSVIAPDGEEWRQLATDSGILILTQHGSAGPDDLEKASNDLGRMHLNDERRFWRAWLSDQSIASPVDKILGTAETDPELSQLYVLAMHRGVIKHLSRKGSHNMGFQVDDILYHCFPVKAVDGTIHDVDAFEVSQQPYVLLSLIKPQHEAWLQMAKLSGDLIHMRHKPPGAHYLENASNDSGRIHLADEERFWREWLSDESIATPVNR